MSLCPDNVILAGFLESFAPCSFSALAGYHDGDVICLRRQPVNNPHPTCSLIHLSHLRDGIRMLASCRPTGIPGLPLLRFLADLYEWRDGRTSDHENIRKSRDHD